MPFLALARRFVPRELILMGQGSARLGLYGAASEDDLKNAAEGRDIQSGDAVGKSGIEQTYDSLLAGDHGQRFW